MLADSRKQQKALERASGDPAPPPNARHRLAQAMLSSFASRTTM